MVQCMACAAALEESSPPLLQSPFVLAELDCLLMRHIGAHAQAALLEEVPRGAYRLEAFGAVDVDLAKDVIERYADLQIGLADASIVVLAERHSVAEVLTLDERHFRAMRILQRRRFKSSPSTASTSLSLCAQRRPLSSRKRRGKTSRRPCLIPPLLGPLNRPSLSEPRRVSLRPRTGFHSALATRPCPCAANHPTGFAPSTQHAALSTDFHV